MLDNNHCECLNMCYYYYLMYYHLIKQEEAKDLNH